MKNTPTIKQYQRTLITMGSLLGIISVWFFFIHIPIKSKIYKHKKNMREKIQESTTIQAAKKECKHIQMHIKRIKKDLQLYLNKEKNIPHKNISKIMAYARNTGLILDSCTTKEGVTKNKWFTKQKIYYKYIGNLQQALSFCENLKNCEEMIQCNEIIIELNTQNKCNILCSLDFFFLNRT